MEAIKSRSFRIRILQSSAVNCFKWHRTNVKKRYVIRPDRTNIFLVTICIAWTVTQECTADSVAQSVRILFIVMNVQPTEKAKGVTFTAFLKSILKMKS